MSESKTTCHLWVILLSMCTAVFTMGLMSTGVIDAMVAMRNDLHLSPALLQWLMNAYLLAAASLVIISGRISEIYGRRNVFILGLIIFIVGSVAAAVATNSTVLVIARTLQGVAAAIVAPGAMAILKLSFPADKQAFAVTTWSAAAGLGFSFGPIIGGVLTDGLSWRYLFWLAALLLFISLLLLFVGKSKNKPTMGSRHIDWLGAVLLLLFVVPLFLAMVQGNTWGWGDPWTYGLLIWGAVLFFVLLIVELKKSEPLVLFQLFVKKMFALGCGSMLFNGFNLLSMLFFVSLYLQTPFLTNYSPVFTGVALLPFSVSFFCASIFSSHISNRFGFRATLLCSGLMQSGGFLWLCFIHVGTTYLFLWAPFLMIGWGVGFNMAIFPVLAMISVENEHANKASGLVNMLNYFGGTLAPAIGTIFLINIGMHFFTTTLAHMSVSMDEIRHLGDALFGSVSSIKHVIAQLTPPHTRDIIVHAMQHSVIVGYRSVMIISAALGLIMALLPLALITRAPKK